MASRIAVRAAIAALAVGCLVRADPMASGQQPRDAASLVQLVGERVVNFYRRAQRVICTNTSTVQPIDRSWSAQGFARTVESELRVELDASDGGALPSAHLVREIRRVNGREPRERDKTSRAGCTDPNPLSAEPLAFLLPPEREHYRFTAVHEGRERDRAALIIDFTSVENRSRLELVEDERGHDDCFDWTGPSAIRGQIWVDSETYDVLRLDRRLAGPADVRIPPRLQRRYNFADGYVTLDREDVSMHFRQVRFSDPDETLLLPEKIETVTIVRSALQSTRTTEQFGDYRRFVTEGRIKGR